MKRLLWITLQRIAWSLGNGQGDIFWRVLPTPDALAMLNEPTKPVHAYNPLVQIEANKSQLEETRA